MRNVGTVTRRELSAQFYSPIAYVVIAIFLMVSGIFFLTIDFRPGAESSVRALFGGYMPLILVFMLPMLTMRVLSEEFRSGTIETLMTAPVDDADVVLGKFFGSLLFFGVMLVTTLIYPVLVAMYGPLDVGMALCSYLGMALVGGLFIAVGVFFSACTSNQVIAVVCSFVLLAIFTFLAEYLGSISEGTLRVVLQHLAVLSHYQDFTRGLIDTNHVVYFLTTTGVFLFLAVKVLEFRRWR